MNKLEHWMGNLLGLNLARGPYPMYVTGTSVDAKAPQYLEDGYGTYLEKGFGGNATVYSIIMGIVEMGSAIPWKVQTWKKGIATDVPGHELYDTLLEQPNQDLTWEEFIGEQLGFMCINGEALTWQDEYLSGRFQWHTLAPPHWVLVPGERFQPIRHWHPLGLEDKIFPAEQILQARSFNPFRNGVDDKRGMSPIRAGIKPLSEDHAAVDSSIRAFQNQGPGGIISKEKGTNQETPFSLDQMNLIAAKIEEEGMGVENARRTIVTNGVVKWQQVGLSPVDLNILQQRPYTRGELANLWRYPVQLLNDNSHSTYNNLSEMQKAAYLFAVLPRLFKIAASLNKGLRRGLKDQSLRITPDISTIEVLQQNKKETAETLATAWWIPVDRKQEIMGEQVDPTMKGQYRDRNGQPLPTPEEAAEARLGGPRLPGEEEDEEAVNEEIKKELGLKEYGQKPNGNGKH